MKKLVSFIISFTAMVGVLSVIPFLDSFEKRDEIEIEFVDNSTLPEIIEVEKVMAADLEDIKAEEIAAEKTQKKLKVSEVLADEENVKIQPVRFYIKEAPEYKRSNASMEKPQPLSEEDQMILDMMDDGELASANDVDNNWNDDNLHLNSEMKNEWGDVQ